jgi:3-dehydroquinate synthetase
MTALVTAPVGFDRRIKFGNFEYDYVLRDSRGDPSAWSELLRRLQDLDADGFLVVTEHALLHPFADALLERIADAKIGPSAPISFPASEKAKTLITVDKLASAAQRAGVTRQSCLLLLGGGVVGNIGGLLATLLFRGIRFVHIPMTLLHKLDATPSLKQAVSSNDGIKNILGAFRAPEFVFADLAYLDTLPRDEIVSGLCETVKNVLAICPELFDEVAGLLNPEANYTPAQYQRFIELSLDAKCEVMANDPFEEWDGLRCEYGHGVGHAAEALTHRPTYRYEPVPHGKAVGMGMLVIARAARLLGWLDHADEAAHLDLLRRNGAPTRLPPGITPQQILNAIVLDNKRGLLPTIPGHSLEVVLERLGKPYYTDGRPLRHVPHDALGAALRDFA